MKKIAITGSLASGKTTASKILSIRKGPLFSADEVVKKLYRKKYFKTIISKKFGIKNFSNIRKVLIKKILSDKSNLFKLEHIIHPMVRKEMHKFIKRNKKKKFTFYEIPLLIESKLMNNFDVIIFIKSKRQNRLKRFLKKGGSQKLFHILNNKQFSDIKKIRYCNYVVNNNNNINILKENLSDILRKYE